MNKTINPAKRYYLPATLIIFSIISILFISIAAKTSCNAGESVNPNTNFELHGVWISFLDYEKAGLYNKSEAEFTANADHLFKDLNSKGINTAFFHVRAFNDAIYPSKYFKWSTNLAPGKTTYDALRILVDSAHKHNIAFHAWINPYRISSARIHNPAKKKTTKLIVNGVKEIIQNYDVDGIHFDDYFYPSKNKGYPYYNVSIKKRKKYVNKMVSAVYKAVKKQNPDIMFGISPAGNISYAESIGCDLKTWINKKGYTDYLIPQLYWSDYYKLSGGKKVKYYTKTLMEWTELNKGKKPLYIGLALYKSGAKLAEDPGWKKYRNNLSKQLDTLRANNCNGFVLFSYESMFTKAGKKEFSNLSKKFY